MSIHPNEPGRPSEANDPGATVYDTSAQVPPNMDAETLAGASEAPGAPAATYEQPTVAGATVYTPENTGPAGTEVMDATGVFDPSGQHSPGPARLLATAAFGATGDFTPGAATEAMGATAAFERSIPATCADPLPAGKARPTHSGSHCGRYVLKHFHAKGGMGEIWLAEDPEIGRPVALKRMISKRSDQVQRFRIEAQVTGQLEHPGIVPVHELGFNDEGQPFYVMKFVNGRTLKKVVEEYHAAQVKDGLNEVEQFRLLQMFLSLCQTVAYAHNRGVLHRDLKPENVMLGPYGETILLDWGIAKVMGQPEAAPSGDAAPYVHSPDADENTETRMGSIMGTPSYMAPEVAAGLNAEVDYRSDVYLLGATLYEMLTGRLPRTAKTVIELITKAKYEPPVSARQLNPLVPKALDAICAKAMAHDKKDRYQSATALAEDVQRFVAGEPVSAFAESFATRAWRWAKRHRMALLRSAAAVLIASGALFATVQVRQASREARHLRMLDQARRDLKEFRRLADEASFYAATTDPVSENAPYFDPRKGEAVAQAALARASQWGPGLERLPLEEERGVARQELYDLILLTAYVQGRNDENPETARETLKLLDSARPLHPSTRGEHRLRALAYQRLGEDRKAAEFQRLNDDPAGPTTASDHFLRGEGYRKDSRHAPGRESERKLWEPDPESMKKAIAAYRQALALDPDHYWARFQLGRCYLSLGRLAEAVETLGACVALKPATPWAYSVRGLALAQLKRFDEAEADLNRAVALDPNLRPPLLNRGAVYWMEKKYDQALADFEAVLQPPKEQYLIEAAFYRGQMSLEQGQLQSALNDFYRVSSEKPSFRPVYLVRARVHFARKDAKLGLQDLDAYIAAWGPFAPNGWDRFGLRGHLLRVMYQDLPQEKRKRPVGQALMEVAIGELQQAVALGGRAWDLFDDLGAMHEHAGQAKDALAAYSKGLEIAPANAKLRIKRAWLYEAFNRHDDALADFTVAAQAEPENAEAHSGLGYVRAVRKQAAEAQREAELALLHGSDNYLILHNVACIYAALSQGAGRQAADDQDVAVALLRRAVAVWKKTEDAKASELDLMKAEPAFQPLRRRPDFQQLLGPAPAKVGSSKRLGSPVSGPTPVNQPRRGPSWGCLSTGPAWA